MTTPPVHWTSIAPKDALDIDLRQRFDITAPRNQAGERCPWPWEPQQLVHFPMRQYICGFCGARVIAGIPHTDYANDTDDTQ